MKLLLVEDEPNLVMTLTDRLVAEGYEVEAVGHATAPLERARPPPTISFCST